MKLTVAMIAALALCAVCLTARALALKAAAHRADEAYAEQERLALEAIDAHLRAKVQSLSRR